MNVEIAQRLAERRKQAGLSQEALAAKLGVSRQAVSKWERSESSPDTDNLIALAQLYGVSLDDLLYVDEEMRDDVTFEAADRAAERAASGAGPAGAPVPPTSGSAASVDASSTEPAANSDSAAGAEAKQQKVKIGLGGIHVLDGDDYVHVSWRDGVHVKDGKRGDEVHVGWDGIHVKEAASATRGNAASAGATEGERCGRGRSDASGEQFVATDQGVDMNDDEGNRVVIDDDGVVINGERFDSWRDAHDRYGYGHIHEERWYEPCAYTVAGERFDTLEEARAKYGDEVGKSIPVRKHYLREFEKSWYKFPYPLVVILAYLLLGIVNGAWGMGLFLFFTIPLYYMVGRAVGRRRIAPLIEGAYPLAVTAWFLYMALVLSQPHPAWVAFLTIPLVEWFVHSLSRWWRDRKRRKAAEKTAPIDVEAQ